MTSIPSSLRIALLTYRGAPHCGGQGVYARQLSRALVELGHHVEVFAGPPYPELDPRVRLHRLESLQLYRPDEPFRRNRALRDWIDVTEFGIMCGGGYPEPLTFSFRAARALRERSGEFDIVHDNQCLAYGLLDIDRRLPVVATIHHPVSIDRRLELQHANWQRGLALRRWYAFTRMQARVARRMRRLVAVSEAGRAEIAGEMRVEPTRIGVVPNGVDVDLFKPLPARRRVRWRVVATASSDVPLKGLVPLIEALARVRRRVPAELVVIGKPRPNGPVPALIEKLGLRSHVRFVANLEEADIVEHYAEAELAVVPSLYEGFSLPAVEAMACSVPVVATTAGALPEVVGTHGESALLVPPGDPEALAQAIGTALEDAQLRERIGASGRNRVLERFSWRRCAQATVAEYQALLERC